MEGQPIQLVSRLAFHFHSTRNQRSKILLAPDKQESGAPWVHSDPSYTSSQGFWAAAPQKCIWTETENHLKLRGTQPSPSLVRSDEIKILWTNKNIKTLLCVCCTFGSISPGMCGSATISLVWLSSFRHSTVWLDNPVLLLLRWWGWRRASLLLHPPAGLTELLSARLTCKKDWIQLQLRISFIYSNQMFSRCWKQKRLNCSFCIFTIKTGSKYRLWQNYWGK